ncbi:unnamed protein product [Ambrosiozyma monospora]|uniref:Unnamed protein product n=1 Tax=Ambrosiozyma monospora TaxID=43982 RepID=A0ACB5T7W7_AMBMO|nr:unnamed protein product [Ambrosiozyma monospora]
MAWSPTLSTSGAESDWQDLVSHCSDSSSGVGGIECVSVGISTILASAIQYGLYINGSSSNFEYSDGSVSLDLGSASSGTKTFQNVTLAYQNANLFSLDFDYDDSVVEVKASIHPDSYTTSSSSSSTSSSDAVLAYNFNVTHVESNSPKYDWTTLYDSVKTNLGGLAAYGHNQVAVIDTNNMIPGEWKVLFGVGNLVLNSFQTSESTDADDHPFYALARR